MRPQQKPWGGNDGIFCIKGGEEGVGVWGGGEMAKMSSDVAAVMKREAND